LPVVEANFIVLVDGKHDTADVLAIVPANTAVMIMIDCIMIALRYSFATSCFGFTGFGLGWALVGLGFGLGFGLLLGFGLSAGLGRLPNEVNSVAEKWFSKD
jgi:hypothetical protein